MLTYISRNEIIRSNYHIWWITDRCQRATDIRIDHHAHQYRHRIQRHNLTEAYSDRCHQQHGRHII